MVYQLFVEEKNQPNQYHILEKKTTPPHTVRIHQPLF
jgi:hypothetical protein